MVKTFQTLFLCSFLLTINVAAQAQFSGSGSGTLSDPYIITTPAQLNEIRNGLDSHYRLANDIDLTDYLAPGGAGYAQWGDAGWMSIGHHREVRDWTEFTGSLNGAGFKITGLWINRPDELYVGFFGSTSGATIDSLGIEIAEAGIKGGGSTGGLVGVQGHFNDNISNSYVTGNVSGGYSSGTGISTGVGGLVGMQMGILSNSYFIGSVTGLSPNGFTGGLAGSSYMSNISNSYATGSVRGGYAIGGLIGVISESKMSNCYAAGSVRSIGVGSHIGGLIGERQRAVDITNSFFDIQATGQRNGVGFSNVFGDIQSGITGKITKKMQVAATFEAWDLSTVWSIYEGYGYPFLRSFNNDILIIPIGGSKIYDGRSAPAPIAFDVVSDNPTVDVAVAKAQLTGELAYSIENPTNVGEYVIRQHTLHSFSHQVSFKHDVIYTISPRSITVAAIDETIYYGETPALAYHITSGNLVSGDALRGALHVGNLSVGTHTITQGTLTAGNNYLITFSAGRLTILPAR